MNPSLLKKLETLEGKSHLITIDGVAGCGKTTLAGECEEFLRGQGFTVETIHMDDLYNGWGDALTASLTKKLTAIIEGFTSGIVTVDQYDWIKNTFIEPRIFISPDILILEGVGSGQKSIRNDVALSIWIDMDARTAFERVISRDGEGVRPYMNQWLMDQEAHFQAEGPRGAADYCIDGAP